MDADMAVLTEKMENIEAWREKHERDDERTHKYMSNMMEDLIGRLAGIERSAARFEADLAHRNGNDLGTQESLREIFNRIRTLERLAYIAIGGVGAIGAIATFFGWNILKLLGK